MKCSAWIRTCVDVFDHPVLDNGSYDRRSAWLWLIAKASRLDRTVSHKGRPLNLKRGQVLAGRAFLANTWGWGEKQVRLFLELLAAENMIEKGQSNGHYANVITICNYDAYQSAPTKRQPVQDSAGPVQGQLRASGGPVQGQTLTQIQEKEYIPCAGAKPEIPDGFSALGHGAQINSETIKHRDFVISIAAVKMALALTHPDVDARQACSIAALQWAAAIEGGQRRHEVVPGNITGAILGGVRIGKFREAEHESRKARGGWIEVVAWQKNRAPGARRTHSKRGRQMSMPEFIRRLMAVYGEPRTEDPAGFILEYQKALGGYSDEILAKTADQIIREVGPFWPRPAEAVRIARTIADRIWASSSRQLEERKQIEAVQLAPLTPEARARAQEIMDAYLGKSQPKDCDPQSRKLDVSKTTFEAMQRHSRNQYLHRKTTSQG